MSSSSAESEERKEKDRDENPTQFLDESSLLQFLLSEYKALCGYIFPHFEDLHTLLIDIGKKVCYSQQISPCFRANIQGGAKCTTNRFDASIPYFRQITNSCII